MGIIQQDADYLLYTLAVSGVERSGVIGVRGILDSGTIDGALPGVW